MPRYRVYFLRDDLSRRFRELSPSSVRKQVKQREYEPVGEVEAANAYAVWQALQSPGSSEAPLSIARQFSVGDVLEQEDGSLRICLFGGFEEASWWTPPAQAPVEGAAAAPAEQTPASQAENPPSEPNQSPQK